MTFRRNPKDDDPDAHGIETHGVDYIPEGERTSSPKNIITILLGANLTLGLVVIGWLPISFGLGWWPALWAILIGNAVGALVLAPVALVGMRTGTNGPVSSGAYFGVVGRIIGSIVGLLLTLGFYALAVWSGGQTAAAGLERLLGVPATNTTLVIVYVVIAIAAGAVAIWGHSRLVAVERYMLPVAAAILLLGVFAYAHLFSPTYAGGQPVLGSFWSTWFLAVTVCAVTVYGYAPVVSDWTRYISPQRYSSRAVFGATWVGAFVGLSLPLLFGAYTAVAVLDSGTGYIPGLVASAPSWYLIPLVVVGTVGTLGQGSVCLYSSGLDTSSLIPRLRRPTATVLLSVVALVLVCLGTMVASAESSVSGFLQVLSVPCAAWIGVVVFGHFGRRGIYDHDALQVFTRGETGGRYWFTGGWNLRALGAYVVGVLVGLLTLHCYFYTGPLAHYTQGIDLSWLVALVITTALYFAQLLAFPESGTAWRWQPQNSTDTGGHNVTRTVEPAS